MFQSIGYAQEIHAQALRHAEREGLRGTEKWRRARDLVTHPTDEMVEAAQANARYQTFATQLGPKMAALHNFYRDTPAEFVIPFLRTPTNIFKYAAERNPVTAPLLKGARDNLMGRNGDAARDMQAARILLGTGIGYAIYELAMAGFITGGPPVDRNEAAIWRARNIKPYALRWGNDYWSFTRIEPIGIMMAVAADIATFAQRNPEKGDLVADAVSMFVASVQNAVVNRNFLLGVQKISEAFSGGVGGDKAKSFSDYMSKLGASFLIPNFVSQWARAEDPVLRETRTFVDELKARLPGERPTLIPKRDFFGEPINAYDSYGIPFLNFISPIYRGRDRVVEDKALKALVEIDWVPDLPGRYLTLNGVRTKLSDEQYDRYAALAGAKARALIQQAIAAPDYLSLDAENARKLMQRLFDQARAKARKELKPEFERAGDAMLQEFLDSGALIPAEGQ